MKLLLLMPDANIHRIKCGPGCMSFREAPLTLTTLAALIPSDVDIDITLIDENVQRVPANKYFDLVAISCLTGTAFCAYEWAAHFRKQGATIILGGIHVSLCPDEAVQHADVIMTGFSETTWPKMIRDFSKGNLKPRYNGFRGDATQLPPPRRDLQKRFGYAMPYTITATRGCGCVCSFCSVPAADYGWQTRPIEKVIDEIRNIPARRFTFNDVNLLQDRSYAMELLKAIEPLNKLWGGLATLDAADDPELMDALKQAGCQYLLCGFESLSSASLEGINKGFNKIERYTDWMDIYHEFGISIQGCFVFGFDEDHPDIFQNTVEWVNQLKVDIPRYAISTPYPKTELYQILKKKGRLLHEYWNHYDTQHVVFQPTHMTPEQLDEGFKYAYSETFNIKSIQKRTQSSPHPLITGIGNLAYRLYLKRLNQEPNRIHKGQVS